MYKNRKEKYAELEQMLGSRVIVYVTGDRRGMETQIGQDVIELFVEQLEKIGCVERLSLYLYTRGGDTAAAWNIINLLRQYCRQLQVIVPHKAHSGGTLISLGADEIIMTRQATLSPIDPSVNTPLNPRISEGGPLKTMPVSVEAIKGYLDFAKEELGIQDDMALSNILIKLTDNVHPLVLGQVYRTRSQIKMLAEKLLKNQVSDTLQMQKVIDFLCSDSGSHDYTINSREARNELGLNVITPDDRLNRLIKEIYDDINGEIKFGTVFDVRRIEGTYAVTRGLIESIPGGTDQFISEGRIMRVQAQNGNVEIRDERVAEGWRHFDK